MDLRGRNLYSLCLQPLDHLVPARTIGKSAVHEDDGGWDPSCWFSLTPSSLVEGSDAELLHLALLCEGQLIPLLGAAHLGMRQFA